jgi:hypothetical protein
MNWGYFLFTGWIEDIFFLRDELGIFSFYRMNWEYFLFTGWIRENLFSWRSMLAGISESPMRFNHKSGEASPSCNLCGRKDKFHIKTWNIFWTTQYQTAADAIWVHFNFSLLRFDRLFSFYRMNWEYFLFTGWIRENLFSWRSMLAGISESIKYYYTRHWKLTRICWFKHSA